MDWKTTLQMCAENYDKHLKDKNLLFVLKEKKIMSMETEFSINNFQHLTGLKYTNSDGKELNAKEFYKLALSGNINQENLKPTNGKTEQDINQKLMALIFTSKIHVEAQMVGDYNESGINLLTEKLAGSQRACLGFVYDDKLNGYAPNTNIFGNFMSLIIKPYSPIILTMRKNIHEEKYNEITRKKDIKGIDWNTLKLPQNILEKLTPEAQAALNQSPPASEVTQSVTQPITSAAPTVEAREKKTIDIEKFTVVRHIGGKFTVTYGEKTQTYDLPNIQEKREEVIGLMSDFFNAENKDCEYLIECAEETNAVELAVAKENGNYIETEDLNKSPPNIENEIDIND